MGNRSHDFPDFPELRYSPIILQNPTTPIIPQKEDISPSSVPQNDTPMAPAFTENQLYIYDYLQKTSSALKARIEYYDETIAATDKICKSHSENVKLIHALLWYSMIATIFLLLFIALICFLYVYILNSALEKNEIISFIDKLGGLLTIGSIGAFISIFFINNFHSKFSEIDKELKDIRELLSKNKIS